jgi:hypothetical protein
METNATSVRFLYLQGSMECKMNIWIKKREMHTEFWWGETWIKEATWKDWWDVITWTGLIWLRVKLQGFCERGNEPSGSEKCRNFLTSFSRRSVLHGVSQSVRSIWNVTSWFTCDWWRSCAERTKLHADQFPFKWSPTLLITLNARAVIRQLSA